MTSTQSNETRSESKFNNQFLAALENPIVIGKFAGIIKEAIVESFNALHQKISDLSATVSILRSDLQVRDATIASLRDSNVQLRAENENIKKLQNELDSNIRRENLIFSGIALSFADTVAASHDGSSRLRQQVLDICNNDLQCELEMKDISHLSLLPRRDRTSATGSVIVRFVRRDTRDNIFFNKKKLTLINKSKPSGQKIFINEDLLPAQRTLFSSLRQKVKDKTIQGAWSKYCNLYAKMLNGSIKMVKSLNDIYDP
jgi:regulator of replication initiation timing